MVYPRFLKKFTLWVLVLALFVHPLKSVASETTLPSSGIKNYQNGLYLKAVRDLKTELSENPGQPTLYNYLGLSYLQLNKYPESIKAFRELIRIQPDFPNSHLNLGIVLYISSQYREALLSFKQALLLNPENGSAHFFAGLALKELKETDQALKSLSRAETLNPNYLPLTQFHRGMIFFHQKRFRESTEDFKRALQADPNSKTAESIRTMLEASKIQEEKKSWEIAFSAGGAYDDNVALIDVDTSTGLGDYSTFYQFSGNYKAIEKEDYSLGFGYYFFQSLYEELTGFNVQSHTGAIYGSKTIMGFNFDLQYLFNYSFLATRDFAITHTVIPAVNFQIMDSWLLRLEYLLGSKNFVTIDTRDGTNHALKLANFFSLGKDGFFWLAYSPEKEWTRADVFIYFGQNFSLGVEFPIKWLNLKTKVQASYNYQIKDFQFISRSIGVERFDSNQLTQVNISQPLFKGLNLDFQYQHINNSSNLPANNYKENVYRFSLRFAY